MKLNRLLIVALLLFASVARLSAQVSSENLVSIHNLNTSEISGLVSPIKGSLVYNTDSNRLYVFDGTLWIATATVDTTSLSTRINQRVKYTDTASMLVGYLRKSDTASMLSPYLNQATNGLTKSGQSVTLGGNLTGATSITNNGNALTIATGGSAFNISGLSSGAATDSLLTINTVSGRVNRIAPTMLNKVDSTTASNGLTLTGKDVRLGGTLTAATTITNSGANTLRIASLASGSANDSLVVADASTGELKRIAGSRLSKADSTTASNGLTLTGKDVRLGGTLTAATTITNSGANTLRIASLASGSANDSLVVADASTGELKRIAGSRLSKADSTTASNGLTLSGKDVQLGGNLTSATTVSNNGNALTIATGGSALNVSGLTSGSSTDSLLTINPTTNRVNRVASSVLSKADSTTASNGLTLTGKDVRLGGALSAATTVTTTGANTLAVAGLQSGSTNDSLVVADATSGVLKRVASSRLAGWSLTGNAGTSATNNYIGTSDNTDLVFKINNVQSGKLTLYDLSASFGYNSVAAYKSVAFGSATSTGTGTEASAYGYNAQSTGYQSVSVGSDSRATGNNAVALGQNANAAYQATAIGSGATATGNNSTAIGFGATTAQANALILGNSSAQVGIGTSTPGYALDVNSGSNPLKLSGLQAGNTNDSVLTVNTSGVVRRINAASFSKPDSTTASNGLTLSSKDVRLGGSLTAATTITSSGNALTFATGGTAFNITGLTTGSSTDSIMTITSAGKINRINAANFSTTASNGLAMTGSDVRLGGNLTGSTTITNNSNTLTFATGGSNLNITGLTAGASTDSILTINASTGKVNRINAANFTTTASNGLTMTGADVRLGGSLSAATTITTTGTNTLTLAGLQTSSLNDSVMMISSGGVVRRINSSSVAVEPFNVVGGSTKASSNTQDIYTQGNVSIGKTSNAATLEVGGKVKADSSVSAPNFVATYQNIGSVTGSFTWNMQSGATAGITLTGNATMSISNVSAGMYGLIRVTQDATGGRSITLPSGSKVINGGTGAVTLTQAGSSVDILTFFYDGTNYWWTIGNNYK